MENKYFVSNEIEKCSININKIYSFENKNSYKEIYVEALKKIFTELEGEYNKFVQKKLNEYEKNFFLIKHKNSSTRLKSKKKFILWRNKQYLEILCDCVLVFPDDIERIQKIIISMFSLTPMEIENMDKLQSLFLNNEPIPKNFLRLKARIDQIRINYQFISDEPLKILVTANMSAGKSTLINAIIGQKVAKTSQAACTSTINYYYNTLDNNQYQIESEDESKQVNVVSYDFTNKQTQLIDTPGINFALDQKHGDLTKKTILEEKFDKLVYVFNGSQLATNDEFDYLKFIFENVDENKILFVINKVDNFKKEEDSILESVNTAKKDLNIIGFKNPKVFPMSAEAASLFKYSKNNIELSVDDEERFELLKRKFSRPFYNLELPMQDNNEPNYLKRFGYRQFEKNLSI